MTIKIIPLLVVIKLQISAQPIGWVLNHFGSSVYFAYFRSCCKITELGMEAVFYINLYSPHSFKTAPCSVLSEVLSSLDLNYSSNGSSAASLERMLLKDIESYCQNIVLCSLAFMILLMKVRILQVEIKTVWRGELILVKMSQLYFPESCL